MKAWKKLPFNEEHYRKTEVGSTVLTGEPGFSVLYRTWARPTLEVHGMPGGFTAPGAKTVIPAKASAKVSMRLVPNQDPDDILKTLQEFREEAHAQGNSDQHQSLEQRPGLRGRHRQQVHQSGRPRPCTTCSRKTPSSSAPAARFPSSTDFQDVLKIPSVMMGFGLPDDNLHAPNEKFHIPNFYRGIESICLFFEKLGE